VPGCDIGPRYSAVKYVSQDDLKNDEGHHGEQYHDKERPHYLCERPVYEYEKIQEMLQNASEKVLFAQ